jgi:hypothetical protein
MVVMALLMPTVGTAQVYMQPSAYPRVTAANALWLVRGEPIFHASAYYYPTGPTVFFNGNVMTRTGTNEGVPLYEDGTQAASTVVYVPIGGNMMKPYERRREGELAGTTGSRVPSFVVQRDGEVSTAARQAAADLLFPPSPGFEPLSIPEVTAPAATGAARSPLVAGNLPRSVSAPTSRNVALRGRSPSILQMWVPFNGTKWYTAGAAEPYSADRFVRIGDHHGFPVYRGKRTGTNVIYIPSVEGGAVVPYRKAR